MNTEKYIELIHKEIDGVISKREKARLDRILADNPEARKEYDQLTRTSEFLDQVGEIEPSENLKKRIMNSIDAKRYSPARSESRVTRVRTALSGALSALLPKRRSKLVPAYVFALGMIAGVLLNTFLFQGLTGRGGRFSPGIYGTMGVSNNDRFEPLETVIVDSHGVQGTVTLARAEQLTGLEIDLTAASGFDLFLTNITF
jgi:hypothetical protein